jgi:signal transduction histidine kinase
LVTYVPVRDQAGAMLGSIEIAESLGPRDAYVNATLFSTALAIAAMGVIAAASVLLSGIWLIGRPLDQLAAKARRVGAGDLTKPLRLKQQDEIGQLAVEMNAMCERLGAANERAATETAARIQAIEQLRHGDRLITVGKLAAGIAHELGTPLNVVSGRAKMIHRGKAPPEAIADYARVIVEQADRMASIIRQLLDFARRREPNTAPVDLSAVVRAVHTLLDPMAAKHGVALELETSAALVMGDGAQLEQVATNLVVNAIHASPDGGRVVLSSGLESPESPAAGLRGRPFIRVRDFGHGMDAETAKHAFEPFFTTKDVGHGAGLGLSVAHGIVEGHGGSIEITTAPGQGAVFTVYLQGMTT